MFLQKVDSTFWHLFSKSKTPPLFRHTPRRVSRDFLHLFIIEMIYNRLVSLLTIIIFGRSIGNIKLYNKILGKMPGLRQIDIGPVRWRMVTIALGPFDIPVDCPPRVNQDFVQELLFYLYRNTPLKSSLKAKLISIRREVQQYIYHEFY